MKEKEQENKLGRSINWAKVWRVFGLVLFDTVVMNAASIITIFLRFELDREELIKSGFLDSIIEAMPIYTVTTLIIFFFSRLYNSLWEYAGVDELLHIVGGTFIATVVEMLISVIMPGTLPRSYPVFKFMLLVAFISGSRFSYRILRKLRKSSSKEKKRTMIIGAGRSSDLVVREFQTSSHSENKVVCIIDRDPLKQGKYLQGVKIVGGTDSIIENVDKYRIDEIILAIPDAPASEKRKIVSICQNKNCELRTLPAFYQLANGEVNIQKIRKVNVEDLLGRDSIKIDLNEISGYVKDKVILVTGGGGSIGSELSRQIAKYAPKKLIILDIYENNAYAIQQELSKTCPELDLDVLIGSVRDSARIDYIFDKYRPDYVYHAAAHKHVPLMEDSSAEAIKNNIFGTLNVAKACDKYSVKRMLMISTDKAVNPTNVMGASKRVCEMIVQMMNENSKTEYVAVRFGNVLGSNGSVIPLFRKQIEMGGPVTVTHKDIIRYFMTIPEAVSLVLQAGAYAKGGEIFVLDMGEPVRIDDLARNMIKLSGFEPDVDIKIKYTGLRPGEKLFEELLLKEEGLQKTANDLIYVGSKIDFDENLFKEQLDELRTINNADALDVKKKLDLIIGYKKSGIEAKKEAETKTVSINNLSVS